MVNRDLARKHLDRRLSGLQPADDFARPPHGWIRAIREAVGMTAYQLADKLGVSQPRVIAMENAEPRGAITLSSLSKAAEAFDCTLVYALVPNRSLDAFVRERANIVATEQVSRVDHSMRLEDQGVEAQDLAAERERLAAELLRRNLHRLWGLYMNDPLFDADDSGTLLTAEEREGLIPSYITWRRELNDAEQLNIGIAERWAFARKQNVLDEKFLRRLHERMFKDVWKWAGKYRTTAKNIGIDAWQIGGQLQQLVDDVHYWAEHKTYEADEIAVRFHHRLVWIHPFPNGNGRHARLSADLLLVQQLGRDRFTWGRGSLVSVGKLRADYIAALRAADNHDYGLLLKFVR